MNSELAKLDDFNLDFLDSGPAERPPFVKFKQGSWYCRPLTGDQDVDITGSLFCAALPTFRQTKTAWSDDQPAPVEEHAAYLGLGQRLPTNLTSYPDRASGAPAWQDGFAIDGMLFVTGQWHQATFATSTVTSNIQLRQAMQNVKQLMGRTFRAADWSPVWELDKPSTIQTRAGGNVKVPTLTFKGLVDPTGEAALNPEAPDLSGIVEPLVGRIPCDPNTQAPFLLPEAAPAARPMGTNTEAMLASGVAVPQSPGGGSVGNDMNDEIPF